ncbi:MAG TPA: cytochrome P460 family protein [Methylomirabilota bacterium]|nr:cytochrome P460 family protein [Methylomirabilota bacterium]
MERIRGSVRWARAAVLGIVMLVAPAVAEAPPVVPYPKDYKTSLVKYAVVDRVDGMSRDLYVSADAIDALTRDPRRTEFPAGVLFALDVHSAKVVGRDKTGAQMFQASSDGHLVPSKDERTLHLMQKVQPGFGSQNWAFGGFDPVSAEPLKLELPGDCLLCHQAAVVRDMAFSLSLLKSFIATGTVQYRFCRQPGRQVCAF